MPANKRITFGEPPITEVALGRIFLPRPDFLLPYFGAFWARVQHQFPKVEHAEPILEPTDKLNESLFLPRVWFIAKDSSTLVQLQQNRFHYNWRQTPEKPDYIRFPAIQKKCLEVWDEFKNFVLEVTGRPLQPLNAELTYINVIEAPGATSAFEIARAALRDHGWSNESRFLGVPKAFAHNYSFELPNNRGTLKVGAAAARRKSSAKTEKTEGEVLRLELSVRGPCSDDESFEKWSSDAHDFLVTAFKDLTTPAMHKVWKERGN